MASPRTGQVHVLHVMGTLGPVGGMEQNLLKVVRALAPRGIQHSVALLSEDPDIIDFGALARVYRIPSRHGAFEAGHHIARLIQRIAPTVLHVRNTGTWLDAVLGRRMSGRHVPMIASYHGTESLAHATPLRRFMFAMLARETERMFAVSAAARRWASGAYAIPLDRLEVLPNGVDIERFTPAAVRPVRARLAVGAIGRLAPIKNFGLLIRAAAELRRLGHEIEVRIAGLGPELPELEALVQKLGLLDQVRFLGHLPADQIPTMLRELDIFVLSSNLEAHPNVLLEAMATGLPSVATEVGGVPEVLGQGRYGLMVPAAQPAAMAGALQRLCANPELRRELGDAAREFVAREYPLSKMFDAYERLYSSAA